ncbi:hypothetical protein KC717_04300 [Candidatus Dojkabacteria bacterium]|uniref:Uncharacterized protein n=1 Tax=Candidatus Dojkabacteria bacterium TaxID=2099670 RepID=A0A955L987_9BACT|nr:hypothetical protein [Candidatus Dojkabacteria bacterium]
MNGVEIIEAKSPRKIFYFPIGIPRDSIDLIIPPSQSSNWIEYSKTQYQLDTELPAILKNGIEALTRVIIQIQKFPKKDTRWIATIYSDNWITEEEAWSVLENNTKIIQEP